VDQEETAKRFKAALDLGGFGSVEQFAKTSRMGITRLREIYRGRGHEPRATELRAIADECTVPYGLFVLDLDVALDERRDGWQHVIEEKIEQLARNDVERLSQIEARLQALDDELGERDLEDAQLDEQDAETRAGETPDLDLEEGDEG
jgi:transcriptional regulator with XRE-family HTH domain